MNFYVFVHNYGEYEGYSMPLYVWRAEKLTHDDVRKGLTLVDKRLVSDDNINKLVNNTWLDDLEIHEFAEV